MEFLIESILDFYCLYVNLLFDLFLIFFNDSKFIPSETWLLFINGGSFVEEF